MRFFQHSSAMPQSRSRASGLVAWPLVILAVFLLGGCSSDNQRTDTPSQDLVSARAIVDRGIEILESDPDATWDEIKPQLLEIMRSEPIPYLDDAETEDLKRYIEQHRERLRPVVERLNESRVRRAAAATAEECTVYCVLFFLLDCNEDCPVGACFGIWDCEAGITLPDCDECVDEEESPCTDDEDCPSGYRCAKWLFKRNECVKTCDDDSDCPPGQKCKRPFGTSFKRCK